MANPNMVAKVEKYLGLFQEIRGRIEDPAVARTILTEVSKDRRMEEIREEKEMRNGEPATTRQLEYLRNLGVQVKPGLTKKQASLLIDEALEKEEE